MLRSVAEIERSFVQMQCCEGLLQKSVGVIAERCCLWLSTCCKHILFGLLEWEELTEKRDGVPVQLRRTRAELMLRVLSSCVALHPDWRRAAGEVSGNRSRLWVEAEICPSLPVPGATNRVDSRSRSQTSSQKKQNLPCWNFSLFVALLLSVSPLDPLLIYLDLLTSCSAP